MSDKKAVQSARHPAQMIKITIFTPLNQGFDKQEGLVVLMQS